MAKAQKGQPAFFEEPAPTAKGTPRWWEVTVTPIMGKDGKPEKILSISRDVTARKETELEREKLGRELQHRVRNILSVVVAIIRQSLRSAENLESASKSAVGRIESLAKAHSLLLEEGQASTVDDVVSASTQPYDAGQNRIHLEGPNIPAGVDGALAIALTVNELCTNATKYGSLSSDSGKVEIVWNADDGKTFNLRWIESGGPKVSPPSKISFGSRLIGDGFKKIGGEVKSDFQAGGLICTITAPLDGLRK